MAHRILRQLEERHDSMDKLRLSPQEREAVEEWISDGEWAAQEKYKNDKEYLTCVQDILTDSVFRQMENYYQHGHTTCMEHCIRVSYMSYKMCRKKNWDYSSAARAALLHDLFLYDWHTHCHETGNRFHGFTHPRTAMNNASRYFHVTDKEKNIILRHMWPLTPVPPKSREGFVIIYADKFCSLAEVVIGIKTRFVCNLSPVWDRR